MIGAARTLPDARIEGAGLVLRRLVEADVPEVAAAGADEVTQRWLPLPRPYSAETQVRPDRVTCA